MCGIIGGTAPVEFDQSDIKILFMMAMERGKDSCGIVNFDTEEIFKEVGNSREFCTNDLSGYKTWIGHTRAKTTGAVTNRNAHPFRYGNITGAHNGMISNYYGLKSEEEIDINVDSEIIFHLINKYGLKNALPKLRGSLAIAWFEDDALNLYRYNNPISIAPYNGGWVFASLGSYLRVLDIPNEDIISLSEHTHVRLKSDEIFESVELDEDCKPDSYTTYGGIGYQKSFRNSGYTPPFNNGIATGYNGGVGVDYDSCDGGFANYAQLTTINGLTYRYFISRTCTNLLSVEMLNDEGSSYYIQTFDLSREKDVSNLVLHHPDLYEEIEETITEIQNES